jgi:hypothetical protein
MDLGFQVARPFTGYDRTGSQVNPGPCCQTEPRRASHGTPSGLLRNRAPAARLLVSFDAQRTGFVPSTSHVLRDTEPNRHRTRVVTHVFTVRGSPYEAHRSSHQPVPRCSQSPEGVLLIDVRQYVCDPRRETHRGERRPVPGDAIAKTCGSLRSLRREEPPARPFLQRLWLPAQ